MHHNHIWPIWWEVLIKAARNSAREILLEMPSGQLTRFYSDSLQLWLFISISMWFASLPHLSSLIIKTTLVTQTLTLLIKNKIFLKTSVCFQFHFITKKVSIDCFVFIFIGRFLLGIQIVVLKDGDFFTHHRSYGGGIVIKIHSTILLRKCIHYFK